MNFLRLLIKIFMVTVFLLMYGQFTYQEVELFLCGSNTNGSTLIICPSDNMVCIECEASNIVQLEWSFESVYRDASFSLVNSVGTTIERGPISLILIKNEEVNGVNVFKSLLQAPSQSLAEYVRNNGPMVRVSCGLENEKDEVYLMMTDQTRPNISDASFVTPDEVMVTWSTSSEIVNAVVVVKNLESGIKYTDVAGWNKNSLLLNVEYNSSNIYVATVTIYDTCRVNKTSLPFTVNDSLTLNSTSGLTTETDELCAPVMTETVTITSTVTDVANSTCPNIETADAEIAAIFLGVFFGLAVGINAILVVILFILKYKEKKNPVKEFANDNINVELQNSIKI